MNYTGSEIIRIAIGEEKDAIAFYKIAFESSGVPEVKDVFLFLLNEEKRHLALLETEILPTFSEPSFAWEDEEMIRAYLRTTGKSAMFQDKGKAEEFATTHNNINEILDFAIGMEKEAIEFYKKVKGAASPESGVDALNRVIEEEGGHILKLSEIKKEII